MIDYDKMARELQTEFFSLLEKARRFDEAGDEKKYKSYIDLMQKVARSLIDIRNQQKNLGLLNSDPGEGNDIVSIIQRYKRRHAEEEAKQDPKKDEKEPSFR